MLCVLTTTIAKLVDRIKQAGRQAGEALLVSVVFVEGH